MIFTAGLGNFSDARDLVKLAQRLDARVLDVRASLKYRRAGFGRIQLTDALTAARVQYAHEPRLGGLPVSQRDGRALPRIDRALLRSLASVYRYRHAAAGVKHALLVCACVSPGDCHRHLTIGYPLASEHGAEVWHVYNDAEYGEQFIHAIEMQRAIDDGDDYEFARVGSVLR